jgi:hypothetical protein
MLNKLNWLKIIGKKLAYLEKIAYLCRAIRKGRQG